MRIVICSSKSWFKLNPSIGDTHVVKYFQGKDELSIKALVEFKPDYVFFTHWNWIVKDDIHQNFNCVVFHTAPLPYGRGGSPIQNLILEGFDKAPVCAIKMTRELDSGPIYASSAISLAGSLKDIFLRLNVAVNDLIEEITENNPSAVPQRGEPHIFKRLTIEDNEIPMGLGLEEIYDRIRMVDHDEYPNAFITYDNIKLEFGSAKIVNGTLEVACVIKK
jgi:methionyl-tRNA formyltransferase